MSIQQEVFELVQSLSKSEKRFFRLQSSVAGEGQNYLLVFDVLDGMKKYDKALLKKKIPARINLSYESTYLLGCLLRALRNFHSESNLETRLRNALQNIDLLHKKRLMPQAQRLLEKHIALAAQHEFFTLELELIDLYMRMRAREGNYKALEAYKDEQQPRKKELLRLLQLQIEVESLTFPIFAIAQVKGMALEPAGRKRLEELLKRSKQLLPAVKGSFVLSELLLVNLAWASAYLGNYADARVHALDTIELYEAHPHFIEDKLGRYLAVLGTGVNRALDLNLYDEALAIGKKMEDGISRAQALRLDEAWPDFFYFIHHVRIDVYLAKKNYDAALKHVELIEQEKHKVKAPVRYALNYNLKGNFARACFHAGQYKKALAYVNELFDMDETRAQKSSVFYIHLLRLMIHYELGNYDLLESLCRSASRYFSKSEKDEFTELFIAMMRKLIGGKVQAAKVREAFYPRMMKASSHVIRKNDLTNWVETLK